MKQLMMIKSVLEKMLEKVVITIMAALVLAVLWQILSRYVLGSASSWSEELAKILLVWGSLLGSAIAYAEKSHLGVDYFVGKLNPLPRSIVALVVHVLVGAGAAYVMIYGGNAVMQNAFTYHQTTAAMRLEWGYVYLALPIAGAFFVIFAAEFIGVAWKEILLNLRGKEVSNG